MGKIREGSREVLYEPHLEGPGGDWIGRGEERCSRQREHLVELGPAMMRMELMGAGGEDWQGKWHQAIKILVYYVRELEFLFFKDRELWRYVCRF